MRLRRGGGGGRAQQGCRRGSGYGGICASGNLRGNAGFLPMQRVEIGTGSGGKDGDRNARCAGAGALARLQVLSPCQPEYDHSLGGRGAGGAGFAGMGGSAAETALVLGRLPLVGEHGGDGAGAIGGCDCAAVVGAAERLRVTARVGWRQLVWGFRVIADAVGGQPAPDRGG